MKHLKKQTLILLSIASLFLVGLAAFAHLHKKEEKPSYSNLNNKVSLNEVRSILSKHLDKGSVDNFINLVLGIKELSLVNGVLVLEKELSITFDLRNLDFAFQ